jgi:magnesium-protoporphyrin O-methyltransferase
VTCCQCRGIESQFNEKYVVGALERYRKKGPSKTTRLLIDGLKAEGVAGMTLLDIGGGIGAVQHELLESGGVQRTLNVEASSAFLDAAKTEAERQGHADRIRHYHGDFVVLAADIPAADIVTLDRVICCYEDMRQLVGLSTARAGRLYGVVYPRDTWWMKAAQSFQTFRFRLQRHPFRTYVHSSRDVEALLSDQGLRQHFYRRTLLWQVAVYAH